MPFARGKIGQREAHAPGPPDLCVMCSGGGLFESIQGQPDHSLFADERHWADAIRTRTIREHRSA